MGGGILVELSLFYHAGQELCAYGIASHTAYQKHGEALLRDAEHISCDKSKGLAQDSVKSAGNDESGNDYKSVKGGYHHFKAYPDRIQDGSGDVPYKNNKKKGVQHRKETGYVVFYFFH